MYLSKYIYSNLNANIFKANSKLDIEGKYKFVGIILDGKLNYTYYVNSLFHKPN